MYEGIYFADAELPFHVWVRVRAGESGYRWELREARGAGESQEGPGTEPGAGAPPPPAERSA